uniref:hypothetical protein n=1 Tax=Bacillus pumilus TaxID=1408 RepID=UPI001C931271
RLLRFFLNARCEVIGRIREGDERDAGDKGNGVIWMKGNGDERGKRQEEGRNGKEWIEWGWKGKMLEVCGLV